MSRFLLFIGLSLFLFGCSEESIELKEELKNDYFGIVFPNSPMYKSIIGSRAGSSFETDWEHFQLYMLPTGQMINTPWGGSGSGANSGYHQDVKKEDGWVMVCHSLGREGLVYENKKYIVLYNQRTGYLKSFYYYDGSTANTNGHVWRFSFTKNQALSNVTPPVASPYEYINGIDFFYNRSVGAEYQGLLSNGWNMTEIPLAYDPNVSSEISMHITCLSNTESSLQLYSESIGEAHGTIVSYFGEKETVDPKEKLLNFTKEKSKQIAKAIFPDENFVESNLRKLIAGGIQSAIKSPVDKFFNKFLGSFSPNSPTLQTLDLVYQEKGQTTGTVSTVSRLDKISEDIPIGEAQTGLKLGAWNLSETPIIYIHPVGVLYNRPNGNFSDENEYGFCASGNYKVNVIFNPQLTPHIRSYRIECTPVYIMPSDYTNPLLPDYLGDSSALGSIGSVGSYSCFTNGKYDTLIASSNVNSNSNQSYSVYITPCFNVATYWNLWNKYGKASNNSGVYKYIYAPSNDDLIRGGRFKVNGIFYYLKVSLYAEMEFNGKNYKTLETRTYKPRFEWDPSLMSKYGGMSMTNLNSVAEMDKILKTIDDNTL